MNILSHLFLDLYGFEAFKIQIWKISSCQRSFFADDSSLYRLKEPILVMKDDLNELKRFFLWSSNMSR
ncbi:hypothetical protein PanWU01x14_002440 [Parasponia andersonii]|uniref:Uncharacterized protein n=1 Tax=Parasponia andersonii TaxID=3476 RepID=A0A2P5E562_PARAD|nr:hypothetical protein PanWU01x14_002440 [Parasponia andersonii]